MMTSSNFFTSPRLLLSAAIILKATHARLDVEVVTGDDFLDDDEYAWPTYEPTEEGHDWENIGWADPEGLFGDTGFRITRATPGSCYVDSDGCLTHAESDYGASYRCEFEYHGDALLVATDFFVDKDIRDRHHYGAEAGEAECASEYLELVDSGERFCGVGAQFARDVTGVTKFAFQAKNAINYSDRLKLCPMERPAKEACYVGCYKVDFKFDVGYRVGLDITKRTPQGCREKCFRKGFPMFKMRWGHECFCGTNFAAEESDYVEVDDSHCIYALSNDVRWNMGSIWMDSVYRTECEGHPWPVDCKLSRWEVTEACPACSDGLEFVRRGRCHRAKALSAQTAESLRQCRAVCAADYRCSHVAYSSVEKRCIAYTDKKKPCDEMEHEFLERDYFFETYKIVDFPEETQTRSVEVAQVGAGAPCDPEQTKTETCGGPEGLSVCTPDFCDSMPLVLGHTLDARFDTREEHVLLGAPGVPAERVVAATFCQCAHVCQEAGHDAWYVAEAQPTGTRCECLSDMKMDRRSKRKIYIRPVPDSNIAAGFGAFDDQTWALLQSKMTGSAPVLK